MFIDMCLLRMQTLMQLDSCCLFIHDNALVKIIKCICFILIISNNISACSSANINFQPSLIPNSIRQNALRTQRAHSIQTIKVCGYINPSTISIGSCYRIGHVYSLDEYAMDRRGLSRSAARRWGRKFDRERKHNFGNVEGNEELGDCNPEYKFAEAYFDEDDGCQWPPKDQLIKTGNLRNHLKAKTGGPYGSYKSLLGEWKIENDRIAVIFDRIQSDPFAPPSNVRIRINADVARYAYVYVLHGEYIPSFPQDLISPKIINVATCDYVARQIRNFLSGREHLEAVGGPKKRTFEITPPTQYVLQRKSVVVNSNFIEARLFVHLPAFGRRIDGNFAAKIFLEDLPLLVNRCLLYSGLDSAELYRHVRCIEDQEYLRRSLKDHGLIGFVANGAILPRESGVSDLPLPKTDVKRFLSPKSLEVTITLPNKGPGLYFTDQEMNTAVVGMGIKPGVTLVVGGGYHGKSTLLGALQAGIYNKVPGDGREYVVVSPNAVKVRAEDGRSVTDVDISTFIGELPNKRDGSSFSSSNASGSTSQAAAIMESIEMGADVLLLDEDISASNLLFRDNLMDALVVKEKEPITTFLMLTRGFYEKLGISTILVSGSCGSFIDRATCVIQMDEYAPHDKTDEAKQLCREFSVDLEESCNEIAQKTDVFQTKMINSRIVGADTFKRTHFKIKQHGLDEIQYGTERIDLGLVEQLVDKGQTRTIVNILFYLENEFTVAKDSTRSRTLRELLEKLYSKWQQCDDDGYNALDDVNGNKTFPVGDCVMPRIFEVAAAINRLGRLKVLKHVKTAYEPQVNHPT